MANLRSSESNSTVRSSWVNSTVSCRRIASEVGLKDHIFLHFLWMLATGTLCGGPEKWVFFRYFSAVSFDHIFERKLKFSAAKSKSGVASFRTKVLFFWLFCAAESANPLLDWGKNSGLSPTVELLGCSVQTSFFLIENSGNSPNSLTPKRQLF